LKNVNIQVRNMYIAAFKCARFFATKPAAIQESKHCRKNVLTSFETLMWFYAVYLLEKSVKFFFCEKVWRLMYRSRHCPGRNQESFRIASRMKIFGKLP